MGDKATTHSTQASSYTPTVEFHKIFSDTVREGVCRGFSVVLFCLCFDEI